MRSALTLGLAAVFVLPVASAGAQTKLPSRTFIQTTSADAVDVGTAGDSLGDMTIFTFGIYARRGGTRLGKGHGYCVRTEVGVANTCQANWSLPGGRIMIQWEQHDGERAARAAITGG